MGDVTLRTIGNIRVDVASIEVGGNVIVARCYSPKDERPMLIRCYLNSAPQHHSLYPKHYHREELPVYNLQGQVSYVDIVLTEWTEGKPLDTFIGAADSDYTTLSHNFDRLALTLLNAEEAHGDIKPENIIVDKESNLHLIDFDSRLSPHIEPSTYGSMGTAGYQHPRRAETTYSLDVDDYPIAIISTILAALAADHEAMERFILPDKRLILPDLAIEGRDEATRCATEILARIGDAAHMRIAQLLRSQTIALHGLREYLGYALQPRCTTIPHNAILKRHNGLWGYAVDDEWAVPPLYDVPIIVTAPRGYEELLLGHHSHILPRKE